MSELELKLSDEGDGATPKPVMTAGAGSLGGGSSGESTEKGDKPTAEPSSSESRPSIRKLTLPSLPKFSGENKDDDAFERWIRKLTRHAELERWTDQEKLL